MSPNDNQFILKKGKCVMLGNVYLKQMQLRCAEYAEFVNKREALRETDIEAWFDKHDVNEKNEKMLLVQLASIVMLMNGFEYDFKNNRYIEVGEYVGKVYMENAARK